MSILGNIFDKILGKHAGPSQTTTTPFTRPVQSHPAAAPAPAATAPTPAPEHLQQVDVAALLDGMAKGNAQKLDWRHSIVDMMKLLGMDSGLAERKALAQELGYTADTSDTAKMNLWLHEQVLHKLADNGGKVPAELLH
jgi:hypothetical protein